MNQPVHIAVEPHPLLELAAFVSIFPSPIGELETPQTVLRLLDCDADAPVRSSDELRKAVRDLLRHGGFKPTGRSKPSAEYLIRAVSEGALGTINLPVDICNVVSLHSGLPISLTDLDRANPPFRVGIADRGSSYIFNQSGQVLDTGGLLCLHDGDGPCANAVKDAQRTKTTPLSKRILTVIWGVKAHIERLDRTKDWYFELLRNAGAELVETQSTV